MRHATYQRTLSADAPLARCAMALDAPVESRSTGRVIRAGAIDDADGVDVSPSNSIGSR